MARFLLAGLVMAGVAACGPSSRSAPTAPSAAVAASPVTSNPSAGGATVSTEGSVSTTGIGSAMPAYYDGKIFKINFTELPPGGETANLTHNGSLNNIYQSDACVAAGTPFTSVIDAIPTDGMNPLWQEVQIVFANPSSCTQFTSDDQVLAAAAAGTITLHPTGELYRCSVIGKP
jgi:hypothetical protein